MKEEVIKKAVDGQTFALIVLVLVVTMVLAKIIDKGVDYFLGKRGGTTDQERLLKAIRRDRDDSQAAEERAENKRILEGLRAEVNGLRGDVSKLTASLQSAVCPRNALEKRSPKNG